MPITTWLRENELNACQDKDIRELLAEILLESGEYWFALPYAHSTWGNILRYIGALSSPPKTHYSLFKQLDATTNECQIMNFYLETSGTTLNTIVPKEMIIAYLYGLLGRKHG